AHDPDAGTLRERAAQIHDGARRLSHTANQLLALARAEPSANAVDDFRRLELRELCEDVVARHFDRSVQREIDLGVEAAGAAVHGSAWLLRELLVNLVDNALNYTPAHGHVTVRCGIVENAATAERTPFLEVEDDGPGIPADDRTRVIGRFYRAPGALGDGCGLGLAIVDQIARAHGAQLEIGSGAQRGARVRVTFARVAQ